MRKPLRILHVVGGMNRGGTETWLMHVLRHIDRQQFQMDFLVHTTQPCAYDDEIRAFGSKIIPCLHPSDPLNYARNFKRILHECGPYDIVHSHVHHFSGYVLYLAAQAGVSVRIAHSHSDTSMLQKTAKLPRRIYLSLMTRWLHKHATHGLGCSRAATAALFGSDWSTDPRYRVLYNGIDFSPFEIIVDDKQLRSELGIPQDGFVIGHVGRFVKVKNHKFIVDVAIEILKQKKNAYFLLVGDGPLRSQIEEKVLSLGIGSHFIFTGTRKDIPQLLGTINVCLFPSYYEGFGIALVEAQAMSTPCVCSDTLPQESCVIEQLVKRLSLSLPAYIWAERLLEYQHKPRISRQVVLTTIQKSPFNIQTNIHELEKIYCG